METSWERFEAPANRLGGQLVHFGDVLGASAWRLVDISGTSRSAVHRPEASFESLEAFQKRPFGPLKRFRDSVPDKATFECILLVIFCIFSKLKNEASIEKMILFVVPEPFRSGGS